MSGEAGSRHSRRRHPPATWSQMPSPSMTQGAVVLCPRDDPRPPSRVLGEVLELGDRQALVDRPPGVAPIGRSDRSRRRCPRTGRSDPTDRRPRNADPGGSNRPSSETRCSSTTTLPLDEGWPRKSSIAPTKTVSGSSGRDGEAPVVPGLRGPVAAKSRGAAARCVRTDPRPAPVARARPIPVGGEDVRDAGSEGACATAILPKGSSNRSDPTGDARGSISTRRRWSDTDRPWSPPAPRWIAPAAAPSDRSQVGLSFVAVHVPSAVGRREDAIRRGGEQPVAVRRIDDQSIEEGVADLGGLFRIHWCPRRST